MKPIAKEKQSEAGKLKQKSAKAERNVLPYDRVRLNLRKEDILKPIAKGKQSTHTKQGYQKSDKAVHVLKEIAQLSKVSHDTVSKVKFIEKNAPQEDIKGCL